MPLWRDLLADIEVEPLIILAMRHPLEVAGSLIKRNRFEPSHALALWLRYTLDAERDSRGLTRTVQYFPDLLSDWRSEFDRMRNALRITLPDPTAERVLAINAFLDSDLCHQRAAPEVAGWPRPLVDWCIEAYEAMRSLPGAEAVARLDDLGRKLDALEANAQPFTAQITAHVRQSGQRERLLQWLHTERGRLVGRARERRTIGGNMTAAFAAAREILRRYDEAARHRGYNLPGLGWLGADLPTVGPRTGELATLASLAEELEQARARLLLTDDKVRRLEAECDRLRLAAEDYDAERRRQNAPLALVHDNENSLHRSRARSEAHSVNVDSAAYWRTDGGVPTLARAKRTFVAFEELEHQGPYVGSRLVSVSGGDTATLEGYSTASFAEAAPRQDGVVARRVVQPVPAPLRVVIVTPDIYGPIRNGGIGTAFAALAQQFVGWGSRVTIAYALGAYSEGKPVDHWRKHYARLGIDFVALDRNEIAQLPTLSTSDLRRTAWQVYRWLKDRDGTFDLAIFPEWMGLGYYTLLAKGQGLAFGDMSVAVNTHSPDSWANEGNAALPSRVDDVDRDFMERESVRRSDWVISPSHYMLNWMRGRGWSLPRHTAVIQNLMNDDDRIAAVPSGVVRPMELVFFGRLELRKGLKLFCDAVDRLPEAQRRSVRAIRFLGKSVVQPDGFDPRRFIAERARGWGVRIEILTDRDKNQAIAELSRPDVLGVIASLAENSPYTVLECLQRGIRFVASRVGGIPELVHPDSHDACLFAPTPTALAARLENVLTHGIGPARPAQTQDGTQSKWRQWLADIAGARALRPSRISETVPANGPKPLVSICLVHYDRPHMLAAAIASLRAQTYGNIEVVLLDDGSPSTNAQEYLASLEPEFAARDWQIVRQSNQYLGAARNRAAEAARGDYLLFMDDDNLAMPHEVETFVGAALASGADILTCASAIFTGEPSPKPSLVWVPLGGSAGAGLFSNAFGDANALWRRDAFFSTGGYTVDYGVTHEDWELFAEAVLSGLRLEVLPEPLFWYRVTADGMLRSTNQAANQARSMRPYLRHDPHGLGIAAAHAVQLRGRTENGSSKLSGLTFTRVHHLWRAIRMASQGTLRAQFIGVWRQYGFRSAVSRALSKVAY